MPPARSGLGLLLLGALLTLVLYLLLPAAQHRQRSAGARPEEGKQGRWVANATVRRGMAWGEPPVFYREVSAGPRAGDAASPRRWVTVSSCGGGRWGVTGPGGRSQTALMAAGSPRLRHLP